MRPTGAPRARSLRALCIIVAAAVLLGRPAALGAEDGVVAARKMLVASEKMDDPTFARTVVYVVEHNEMGALGMIVNRPIGSGSLALFLEGFGKKVKDKGVRLNFHWGGPVERTYGFVLHSDDFKAEDGATTPVAKGFAWTPTLAPLEAAAEGHGPKRLVFSLGYAGWGPGQLDGEIARGDWQVVPADPAIVFGKDDKEKWKRALAKAEISL